MTGFGQVAVAPSWCNWMPFADFFSACAVPTPGQVRAGQVAEFGPAMTPESRAAALAAGDASVAVYCNMHPDECAGYKAAVGCPTLSKFVGPQVAASLGCGTGCDVASGIGCDPGSQTPWLLYAILAVLGLVALKAI